MHVKVCILGMYKQRERESLVTSTESLLDAIRGGEQHTTKGGRAPHNKGRESPTQRNLGMYVTGSYNLH